MKKKVIYLTSFILIMLGIGILIDQSFFKPTEINSFIATKIYSSPANKAFTDDNFYKCVVDAYNRENRTSLPYTTNLSASQLSSIENLSCDGHNKSDEEKIKSTNGLEKLTSLTLLNVDSNQLSNLDVSKNTALNWLNVCHNQLTILDVSKNTSLIKLGVTGNKLTNLDVSKNTKLTDLHVDYNQLTILDVSKNTALTILNVSTNKLTTLDVSKNTALTDLSVVGNQLTTLDVSKNPALTILYGRSNKLTSINVSGAITLTYLNVMDNQLTTLDVSKNTALTGLVAHENQLTSINTSGAIALTKLEVMNNQLTTLDVSKNTALKELYVYSNQLTSINTSGAIALTNLNVMHNQLTTLDVSKNTALTYLKAYYNQLTSLDVSKNTALKELYVYSNQLTSLDVSKNTALKELDAGKNQLTNLDVSKNTALTYLEAEKNQLTELDVSKNTALTSLSVSKNQLTSLDVSKNTALKSLSIYDNSFASNAIAYIGNITIKNDNNFLKLPEGKTSTLTDLKSDNSDVHIDGTTINIKRPGEYAVKANYKHNIQSFSNSYSITYNIKVVEITSDKYKINEEDNYIYTGTDIDNNTILSNINLDSECTKVIENNELIIKYKDEVLKKFKVINISSSKYDLSKEYIYDINFNKDNINVTNGTSEVADNELLIKYNNNVLDKYKIVSISSTKYDLSKDNIKVLDNSIEEFINNIKNINCDIKIYDGNNYKVNGKFSDNDKLRILYKNDILKEYNLTYGVNGITLTNKNIKLNLDTKKSMKLDYTISPKNADNKNVTWKSSDNSIVSVDNNGVITANKYGDAIITVTTVDGNYSDTCNVNVSELITYTITYQDGDNNYIEEYEEGAKVTWKKDITKKGYTLSGWKYNGKEYKLTDSFTMINKNITVTSIWQVVIPKINNYTIKDKYITGIKLNTKLDNLNLGLDNIYSIKVYDRKNNIKTSGLIATGDKVNIYLDNILVVSYTSIIKGDVTGTGTSSVSDVARLYQYLKGKVTMEDYFIEAGNVVDTDNEIKVGDIAKLYQFIKGKVISLE